jgi:inorganic pyrophosphatase
VVVESPRGCGLKLKYDPEHGVFGLSRPLLNGLTYPYDWGFVPSTRGPDGDPLDVMLLWDATSFPGLLLPCRAIGALAVEQNNKTHPERRERNDRLVAVPNGAPRATHLRDIDDVPQRVKEELEQFFLASTVFERKDLTILGWSGARDAQRVIESSIASTSRK